MNTYYNVSKYIEATIEDALLRDRNSVTFYLMTNKENGDKEVCDFEDQEDMRYPFSPWYREKTHTVQIGLYHGVDGHVHTDLIAYNFSREVITAFDNLSFCE